MFQASRLTRKALLVTALAIAALSTARPAEAASTKKFAICHWCATSCWVSLWACIESGCAGAGPCTEGCIDTSGNPYPVRNDCGEPQ